MNRLQDDIFWVFELEDDGTVVYSSVRPANTADQLVPAIAGHNFFDDASGFFDISELQRRFKTFVRSRKAAERLTLKCSSGKKKFDARVSLTRAFQTGYDESAGVVMLEIRNS